MPAAEVPTEAGAENVVPWPVPRALLPTWATTTPPPTATPAHGWRIPPTNSQVLFSRTGSRQRRMPDPVAA